MPGVPSRVMTVSTGQGVKWSPTPVAGKAVQAMHVVGPQRRHEGLMLVQKGSPAKAIVPVKVNPFSDFIVGVVTVAGIHLCTVTVFQFFGKQHCVKFEKVVNSHHRDNPW